MRLGDLAALLIASLLVFFVMAMLGVELFGCELAMRLDWDGPGPEPAPTKFANLPILCLNHS
jgi:hypothetical protein